jgi:hypothetical protein
MSLSLSESSLNDGTKAVTLDLKAGSRNGEAVTRVVDGRPFNSSNIVGGASRTLSWYLSRGESPASVASASCLSFRWWDFGPTVVGNLKRSLH